MCQVVLVAPAASKLAVSVIMGSETVLAVNMITGHILYRLIRLLSTSNVQWAGINERKSTMYNQMTKQRSGVIKPVNLEDHPEGGKFLQVFKSQAAVTREDGETRSALTHIYYILRRGEVSRFHRVQSDEVWNLYTGKGLWLYLWEGGIKPPERIELSAESNTFCHVVPAGVWQAAEPIGEKVLVGCSVGPGFEYADFELIESEPGLSDIIRVHHPDYTRFTQS